MSATMSEDAAARYIQGLFRTRKARANLARMIGCIYEAVWDEDQPVTTLQTHSYGLDAHCR